MKTQKKLILLRHGQAKNAGASESDAARELTEKGKNDAKNAGKHLQELGIIPDLVLCSPTIRTRQTLANLQESVGCDLPVVHENKIYHAGEEELKKLIAQTSEDTKNLLLVGHNPAIHQLAVFLARSAKSELVDSIYLQFLPCTMVVFSLSSEWKDLESTPSEIFSLFLPQMA